MRILLVAICLCVLSACPRSHIEDKVVLRVNSSELTTRQFAETLAHKLKDYDALYAKDQTNLKRAKESVAQDFVIECLTRDYAKANNIVVTPDELKAAADKVRSLYPDDNAFRRSLSQENVSYDSWLHSLEYTLLQKQVNAAVTKALPGPTDEQIKNYYTHNQTQFVRGARIKVRQIVVEKEEVAKRLYKELEDDGDMAKLAKEFSIAPEGANGGVTDWIEKGSLEVFDQAFKLNAGQRSKIIKSPYGYHIYEVVKKEPEVHLSLAEARPIIDKQLRGADEQTAFSAWLDQELRKAKIYRNEDLIQAVKVSTKGG